MTGVARQGDSVIGTTSGEHNGHYDQWGNPIHGPCTLSGTIVSGSPNVRINGKPVARAGDTTTESDCCDSGRTGTLLSNGSSVRVNGKSVALNGDNISPHNGTAHISSGSENVTVG